MTLSREREREREREHLRKSGTNKYHCLCTDCHPRGKRQLKVGRDDLFKPHFKGMIHCYWGCWGGNQQVTTSVKTQYTEAEGCHPLPAIICNRETGRIDPVDGCMDLLTPVQARISYLVVIKNSNQFDRRTPSNLVSVLTSIRDMSHTHTSTRETLASSFFGVN